MERPWRNWQHELPMQEMRTACPIKIYTKFFSMSCWRTERDASMEQTLTIANLDEATTRYDMEFRSVQGLTWLPWVGQHFSRRLPHQRLLVVGESHYYKTQAEREERSKDPKYTRDIVSEALVNQADEWDKKNKTLDAIPKLLFKTTEIDHPRLWGDSAYYNFVQRLMDYSSRPPEQPSPNDFITGWKVFAEVVRIIQPSHCLFIGVRAADYFNLGVVTKHEQLDGVWPRVTKLEIAGTTTKLIFVHHLARCKNLSQWHDYLQAQHTDFMTWLGAEFYANNRTA
jgi:hypothetical protein